MKKTAPRAAEAPLAVSKPATGTVPRLSWVDKYRPTSLQEVIGQQGDRSCLRKLEAWLRHWAAYHGPG